MAPGAGLEPAVGDELRLINSQMPATNSATLEYGSPARTRTWDISLNRRTLLPTELQGNRQLWVMQFSVADQAKKLALLKFC